MMIKLKRHYCYTQTDLADGQAEALYYQSRVREVQVSDFVVILHLLLFILTSAFSLTRPSCKLKKLSWSTFR